MSKKKGLVVVYMIIHFLIVPHSSEIYNCTECQKEGYFMCLQGENCSCVPDKATDNYFVDCKNRKDEQNCKLFCDDGTCLENGLRCDKKIECDDGSDEENCKASTLSSMSKYSTKYHSMNVNITSTRSEEHPSTTGSFISNTETLTDTSLITENSERMNKTTSYQSPSTIFSRVPTASKELFDATTDINENIMTTSESSIISQKNSKKIFSTEVSPVNSTSETTNKSGLTHVSTKNISQPMKFTEQKEMTTKENRISRLVEKSTKKFITSTVSGSINSINNTEQDSNSKKCRLSLIVFSTVFCIIFVVILGITYYFLFKRKNVKNEKNIVMKNCDTSAC